MDAAVAHDRKVAYVGRSMVRNMGVARELGLPHRAAGHPGRRQGARGLPARADRADLHRAARASRSRRCRGSRSATTTSCTSRRATPSSSPRSLIPGNENAVYRVINGLSRWGANVVHKGNALVHVSGHASAGELLYCYNIVRPSNVMPIHGEIRHLRANAALARRTGVPADQVVLAEDGLVVDLVDGKATVVGKVDCGYVFVDGSSVGDITESSLKDRRILGEEGFISVIVVVDSVTGKVSGGPEIHARGFVEDDSHLRRDQAGDRRRRWTRPPARASTTPTSCSRRSAGSSAAGCPTRTGAAR